MNTLAVITTRLVVNGDLYTGSGTLPREQWDTASKEQQDSIHAIVLERLMLGILKDQHPTTTVTFVDAPET